MNKLGNISISIIIVLGLSLSVLTINESLLLESKHPIKNRVTEAISPILINGDQDFKDQAALPANGWNVGRDGTEAKPFLISDDSITAGSGSLIRIIDTTVYFEINNMVLEGGSYGIWLDNVTHASIIDCEINDSSDYGIYANMGPNDITISGCTIGNTYGIHLVGGDNVIVDDNYIFNTNYGVYCSGCDDSEITNNIIENVRLRGIYNTGDNVLMSRNTISNAWYSSASSGDGIYVSYSNGSTITDNIITRCVENGIELYTNAYHNYVGQNNISYTKAFASVQCSYSRFNTLIGNRIENITGYGIWAANDNEFYSNYIQNTSSAAIGVGGSDNYFESNKIINSDKSGFFFVGGETNTTIVDNEIRNCNSSGIYLNGGQETIIKSNYIHNNLGSAIDIAQSLSTTLEDNIFVNNSYDFSLTGNNLDQYIHEISNNSIDGKELVYIKDQDEPIIPVDVYKVIVVNSSDIDISDREFKNCTTAITIAYCDLVWIDDNIFHDVYKAVDMRYTEYGVFSGNEVYNCTGSGFYVKNSRELSLIDNKFYNNSFQASSANAGIYLRDTNNTDIVLNEFIDNSPRGVHLSYTRDIDIHNNVGAFNAYDAFSTDHAINTSIFQNELFNNSRNGIRSWGSTDAEIYANEIYNNTEEGIYIDNSNSQNCWLNNLIDNNGGAKQIVDDDGTGDIKMNYYSDLISTDTDNDGFTEDSYSFSNNIDSQPLFSSYSFLDPEILSPKAGDIINNTLLIAWDPAVDSLNLSVVYELVLINFDIFMIETLFKNFTETEFSLDTKNYPNGEYNLLLTAINEKGVKRTIILFGEFEIDNIPHTLSAPTVTSPAAQAEVDGIITLQWDPAVDLWNSTKEVEYKVSYSPDEGVTWIELPVTTTDTSLPWDTTTVSDGTEYLIKISASTDEGLTSEAISFVFSIINNPVSTTPTTTVPSTTTTTEITTTEPTSQTSSEETTEETSTSEQITTTVSDTLTPPVSSNGWTIIPFLLALAAYWKRKKK